MIRHSTSTPTSFDYRTGYEPPVLDRRWLFAGTFARAWGLTAVGGGACGLLCLGVESLELFFLTIPVGMVLGVILGLPVGLAVAAWCSRSTLPSRAPARFVRVLQVVGATIALAVNVPFNVGNITQQLKPYSHASYVAHLADGQIVGIGVLCIIASGGVGWWCGGALGRSHVRRSTPPRPVEVDATTAPT